MVATNRSAISSKIFPIVECNTEADFKRPMYIGI